MATRNLGWALLLASFAGFGCGPQLESAAGDGPVAESEEAIAPPQCVFIFQKATSLHLMYDRGGDWVGTDYDSGPQPEPGQFWCLNNVTLLTYNIRPATRTDNKYLSAHESCCANHAFLDDFHTGSGAEQWNTIPAGGGYYFLQEVSTKKYLDAYTSGVPPHYATIQTAQGDDTQQWYIKDAGCAPACVK